MHTQRENSVHNSRSVICISLNMKQVQGFVRTSNPNNLKTTNTQKVDFLAYMDREYLHIVKTGNTILRFKNNFLNHIEIC